MENEQTFIEKLIGIPIPDYVIFIGLAIVIVIILIFIAKGFFEELKK